MSEVYQHAVAPDVYTMLIQPLTGAPNLDTATGVSFTVLDPEGAVATWAATYVVNGAGASATLTASHTFVAGDVDRAGDHKIFATVTFPSGTMRSATVTLNVIPRFGTF